MKPDQFRITGRSRNSTGHPGTWSHQPWHKNHSDCVSQNGKAKSRNCRRDRQDRPQARPGLRGLAVHRQTGAAKVRASAGEAGEEAAPHPDRRRFPPVLPGGGPGGRRTALASAPAAVLHGGSGLASCAVSRLPTWTWRTARFSSTKARAARTATSCSARPSPRPFGRTSPPIPATVGSFRPVATASIPPRRVQQIVKQYAEQAGVKATPHTSGTRRLPGSPGTLVWPMPSLQLITGHARRETLAVYQHVALDGQLEESTRRR